MFKPRDLFDPPRALPYGGTAAIAGVAPLFAAWAQRCETTARTRFARVAARTAIWRDRIEARCHAIDLAPDLADNIGSAAWYRGLATLFGLSLTALAFWPNFTAIESASAMPLDTAQRDEFRSQTIAPLALGGDSGRRMSASALVLPLASVPERPRLDLVATLSSGDTFLRVLQRAGVSASDALAVTSLIESRAQIHDFAPGTRVDITLGARTQPGTPRPLDRINFRARFDLALDIARHDGVLALTARPIPVDTTPLRIRGTVGASLYRSARAAGAPLEAIQQYLRVLDSHVSLEDDIASTDTFDIVVGFKRSAAGETQVGDLLYAGLDRGGKPQLELVRWGDDGQFFAASGLARETSGLSSPVYGRMTSGFGLRRHPILGYVRMHAGIDFGAAWGSPIFAVSDGVVSFAGRHGGHGNYVRLEHGGGLGTGYAHMSRIAASPGMHVRAGQVIGYVGSSGLSTGPHLHYEVYRDGQTVNPLSVAFTVHSQVSDEERARFKQKLAELKAVVPGAALQRFRP